MQALPEPNWAWTVPLVNLLVMVFGGLYWLSALKIALKQFTERLDAIEKLARDHEHRLTQVESKCSIMHPIRAIDG